MTGLRSRNGVLPANWLFAAGKAPGKEFAGLAKTFPVDTMARSGGDMPLCRYVECGQALRSVQQRLYRNELIGVPMNQKHRRPAANLRREGIEVAILRRHEHAGIADDCRGRYCTTQANVKRHHGTLAETNKRQRRRRKIAPL